MSPKSESSDADALDYFLSPEPAAKYFASREPNAIKWLAIQKERRRSYKAAEKLWDSIQSNMRGASA